MQSVINSYTTLYVTAPIKSSIRAPIKNSITAPVKSSVTAPIKRGGQNPVNDMLYNVMAIQALSNSAGTPIFGSGMTGALNGFNSLVKQSFTKPHSFPYGAHLAPAPEGSGSKFTFIYSI